MSRFLGALLVLACLVTPALAERPRDLVLGVPEAPSVQAVTSNVIFLDRCASGCTMHPGSTNSTTDSSSLVQTTGALSAFACGDTAWQGVVSCMKDVFSPYNVVITDVDPGTASHMEIKVAGSPCEVLSSGSCNGIGGVAPATCSNYTNNALVFDFANVWNCNVDEICATAAQEIAHTWSLDHVVDNTDPMTYFGYSGVRYFHDSTQCGSDCTNTSGQPCKVGDSGCRAPNGAPCTTAQTHTCRCGSSSTQNDNQFVLNVFGAGTPTPPTVTITQPLPGAAVSPGFIVNSTVTSPYTVVKAEFRVDGTLVTTGTSTPYIFNAPDTLAVGPHTVEVTGYDNHAVTGKATVMVNIGKPCQKPADCPDNTDTCIGGRCVPGPGVQGGLGSTCTGPSNCADGICASDGTNMYCTDSCTKGQCPSGFGCLPTGTGSGTDGVCWPNYEDGSGGGCSADGGAPATLGLVCLGLVLSRRRRRA